MVEYLVSKIYNQIDNLIRYNIAKSRHNAENKHKRGFTLIEVVVVLAITVLIAGVIYTFYNSNNRTLSSAEAKSIIQTEANEIQKELINIGTQATSISITDGDESDAKKFQFTAYDNMDKTSRTTYVFERSSSVSGEPTKDGEQIYNMYIYKDGSSDKGQSKSKHVKSVKIKALDGKNINDSSNVEITVNMYIKKGLNVYDYPITTIVKLRNKNQ